MEDRRMIFYAILEIGCIITIIGIMINPFAKFGIALMAFSGIAIRIQEEKVFKNDHFKLWSEMKSETATVYFKYGILMVVITILITNSIINIFTISSLCFVLIGIEKTLQKEFLIKTSCETIEAISEFIKKFGISSNKISAIIEYKQCREVVA